MRNFILLLLLTLLFSCESSFKDSEQLPKHVEKKILDGYFIKSVAFDSEGNAWIGTYQQGLLKYNNGDVIVYNSENSMVSDTFYVSEIEVDSKNNIWVAGDGLLKFDGLEFTLYDSSNTSIPVNYIHSIDIDKNDNIWFTSCNRDIGGLVSFDGASWEVYSPENSNLPVNMVRSIAVDNDDNIWLALSEIVEETYLIKISANNRSQWELYTSNDLGFRPYNIGNIAIDANNQVVGSIDYSLSSLIDSTRPDLFIFNGKDSAERFNIMGRSGIHSLEVDDNNNLWCGGYGFFTIYNGVSWQTYESGFENQSITVIIQAPDGKIWLGTTSGIYIFNHSF